MKYRLKAFSLVELSIVLVIVGSLIAGVVRSSRVAFEGRLQSARGITQSSPVSSIQGLSLWLETTLESSFIKTQMVNGGQVTIWKDINPQVPFKLFALKLASKGATYVEKGINALPSIAFEGSKGYSAFRLSTQSDPTVSINTSIDSPNNEYSFFAVMKTNHFTNAENYVFVNGYYGDASSSYYVTNAGARVIQFPTSTPSSLSTPDGSDRQKADIISGTYRKNNANTGTMTLYVNGKKVISSSISALEETSNREFSIGAKDYTNDLSYWEGYLSEFIYFDNTLSKVKRQDVEKYLSRKFYIPLEEN